MSNIGRRSCRTIILLLHTYYYFTSFLGIVSSTNSRNHSRTCTRFRCIQFPIYSRKKATEELKNTAIILETWIVSGFWYTSYSSSLVERTCHSFKQMLRHRLRLCHSFLHLFLTSSQYKYTNNQQIPNALQSELLLCWRKEETGSQLCPPQSYCTGLLKTKETNNLFRSLEKMSSRTARMLSTSISNRVVSNTSTKAMRMAPMHPASQKVLKHLQSSWSDWTKAKGLDRGLRINEDGTFNLDFPKHGWRIWYVWL